MEANDSQTLTQFIAVAFAIYNNMKNQTRAMFTFGKVAIIANSRKQKDNAKSSPKQS